MELKPQWKGQSWRRKREERSNWQWKRKRFRKLACTVGEGEREAVRGESEERL